jgi:hypothetical protein
VESAIVSICLFDWCNLWKKKKPKTNPQPPRCFHLESEDKVKLWPSVCLQHSSMGPCGLGVGGAALQDSPTHRPQHQVGVSWWGEQRPPALDATCHRRSSKTLMVANGDGLSLVGRKSTHQASLQFTVCSVFPSNHCKQSVQAAPSAQNPLMAAHCLWHHLQPCPCAASLWSLAMPFLTTFFPAFLSHSQPRCRPHHLLNFSAPAQHHLLSEGRITSQKVIPLHVTKALEGRVYTWLVFVN